MGCLENRFIYTLLNGFGFAIALHVIILSIKGFNDSYFLLLTTHTYLFSYLIATKRENKRVQFQICLLPSGLWTMATIIQLLSNSPSLFMDYLFNLTSISGMIFYGMVLLSVIIEPLLSCCCKRQ